MLSFGPTQAPLRVACVGDSVTYGAFLENPEADSYPAQLAEKLGSKFEVRNFGIKGACILKKSNKPYINESAFQQVLSFKPDIVIIILGTNDAQTANWKCKSEFENDYITLINQIKQHESVPKIFVSLPLPAFKNQWDIRPEILRNEIRPIIKRVAKTTNSNLIDLSKLSYPTISLKDGVHPDKNGAAQIADAICHELAKRLSILEFK